MKRGVGLALILAVLLLAFHGALAGPPEARSSGDYEYVLDKDGTASLTRYTGHAKALSIPGIIDGHPVKALGMDLFPKGLSVSSILIPGSVIKIGAGAFRFLDKLAAIGVINDNPVFASSQGVLFDKKQRLLHTYPRGREGLRYGIPRGIEAVGDSAFYQCQRLEGVYIPSGVLSIGAEAFYGCKKIANIRLPDSMHLIGGKAFAGCTGLLWMDIPKGVSLIGPGAFLRCSNLEEIWVDSDNPTYVVFNGILVEKETKLLHTFVQKKVSAVVRIPGGIKAIGPLAFSDCFTMQEVTVPASVETIGEEAFARCYGLASAHLPDGELDIRHGVFLDCFRLSMNVKEGSDAHSYAVENGIPFVMRIK